MVTRWVLLGGVWVGLLSGCQGIPRFGRDREQTPAIPGEESRVQSKMPVRPEPDPTLPPAPPKSPEGSPLRGVPRGGQPGVVLLEPGPEHSGPHVPIPSLPGSSLPSLEGLPPVLPKAPASAADPPPLPQAAERQYEPLVLALQDMYDNRPTEALQRLQKYDKETQEFFLRLLPPLVVLMQNPIDKMSAQQIVVFNEQINMLHWVLRSRSELIINKMCLCRRIKGFGIYDPMEENHAYVSATTERQGEVVQVYVELKNFLSEPTKDGDYLTKLACTLELRDGHDERVWGHTYQRSETTHRCKARLNDLHSNFSFPTPALPPGTYKLVLQIIDETQPDHRRVARQSIDFRVTPVAPTAALR